MIKTKINIALHSCFILVLFLAAGCVNNTGEVLPTATETTIMIPQKSTDADFLFTATAVPVQETQTPTPTLETVEIPTKAPAVETSQPAQQQTVKIYLVAMEGSQPDAEIIGCGDQLVAVDVMIEPTQGVLRAALTELLSLNEAYYGESGLYSALYLSTLFVDRIELENGFASVYLTGDFMTGGVCDLPRIEAQLEATATQFSTVSQVQFYINGETLEDVLSLKD